MAKSKKPIIFSVDDDPQVLRSLKGDLRSSYKDTYRIISANSPVEALGAIPELKKKGEEIALFISDQRMPEMEGVDFLEEAQKTYPDAKRVLLTAYSDTNAAIKAINDVQLDYYLIKPWDPPEEKLYPVLDDLLDEWHSNHKPAFQGIKVIGYQYSPKSHRLKDFLAGNLRPYLWIDVESHPQAAFYLELYDLKTSDLPAVMFEDGSVIKNESLGDVASKIGLSQHAQSEVYDVVIVGAGPAGLAAGVYGGSEGLKTLLVERRAPGGQAGTSSRIENYLGFPKGLSGAELSHRAITQVQRFGVEFLNPQSVKSIETKENYKDIYLQDGSILHTKSVVITTGVDYRKLPAKNADKFTGAGVYYGAAMTEAKACQEQHIFIVGGGNSAGQGAVYLSNYAKKVTILIRKPNLTSSMSAYLIDQIDAIENIEVRGYHQVVEALGEDHLEKLVIENLQDGTQSTMDAGALFIFIGAKPATDWINNTIIRDQKGFIVTGQDLKKYPDYKKLWKLDREPYLLETCEPGIFAAGDVRSGSMNRVASAVGEGAMAIKFVHEHLARN